MANFFRKDFFRLFLNVYLEVYTSHPYTNISNIFFSDINKKVVEVFVLNVWQFRETNNCKFFCALRLGDYVECIVQRR